jgi:peptidoglycan hydrolase-like protein with peptidoglycan-binding domain
VVSLAVLLSLPATSLARDDGAGGAVTSAAVLRSAGPLAVGEGYGLAHGSRAVRALQLRLQARGFRPGPIDGIFGPLTRGAVLRFQEKHGLVADGVVGPLTRKPLGAQPAARQAKANQGRPAAAKPSPPEPTRADRVPNHGAGGDSSPRAPIGVDVPVAPAPNSGVEAAPDSSSGISPWIAGALGALAAGLAFAVLLLGARRRHASPKPGAPPSKSARPPGRRLSLGMVFAALLAVFAVGAALGALFATHAADDGRASADEPRAALLPARSTADARVDAQQVRRPYGAAVVGSGAQLLGHP